MHKEKVDLSKYDNRDFFTGASGLKLFLWYFVNVLVIRNPVNPFMLIKVLLLKMFGATIGSGLVIKPGVNIKFPWRLAVGNNVWLGENTWIDNLGYVKIGDNVCISQGAMLLTGNHNFKKPAFNLIVKEIIIEEGAWLGAKSIVCPGVICRTHSVLTANSVAVAELDPYWIYQGNPAQKVKERTIE